MARALPQVWGKQLFMADAVRKKRTAKRWWLAAAPTAGAAISPITEFSAKCPGQNEEVDQAVDRVRGYVYEEWMAARPVVAFRLPRGG